MRPLYKPLMSPLRFWMPVLCLAVLPLRPTLAQPLQQAPDLLQEQTAQAQKRLEQWDEEDRRLERRAAWEIPVAIALLLAGSALATRNMTYGYAASFAAGTGLVVRFCATGG